MKTLRFRSSILLSLLALCLVMAFGAAWAQDPNPPSIRSNRGAWPIRRQWTPAETRHYAQWVERIYDRKTKGTVEQRTAKLERILTDPDMNLLEQPAFLGEGSNPQLSRSIIRHVHSMIDCAKFTAFMPAYYAYRRGLPWMTSYVRPVKGNVRTSDYNIPVGYECSFTCPTPARFFEHAINGYSSGNYRVNLNSKHSEWSDTLPVAISREFLMPGCINYVDGHCLLVAKVTEYGEIQFLNCSTTKTRDIFSYNGMNTIHGITPKGSDPDNEWGGCFQGLRVLRYPIAEVNSRGQVTAVRRRTDEEMVEFGSSPEQYLRIAEITQTHEIEEGGLKPQSFHDFIRLRMKSVDRVAPMAFMETYTDEILDAFKFREDFIQEAWQDVQQNGPIVYPELREDENIFQAFGRWETWSSPSSDVDRRNKYFYLADWCEYVIRMYGMMPEFVDLTGLEKYEIASQSDLAEAMIAEKERLFAERSMAYTNSKGEKIPLTLSDIEERLYDLSFDPNHPPELRWGAPEGSAERASAPERYTPVPSGARVPMELGYRLQRFYRCLGQRETEMSCFRGMFTEGFPERAKFDGQLAKWIVAEEETVVAEEEETPPEPVPPLVPHGHPAFSQAVAVQTQTN